MLPTTYAYTRHLLDATSRGGLAVALAALLPCQWSYGEIGRHLARSLPADPVYRDWISMFSGDGYDDLGWRPPQLLDCPDGGRPGRDLGRVRPLGPLRDRAPADGLHPGLTPVFRSRTR